MGTNAICAVSKMALVILFGNPDTLILMIPRYVTIERFGRSFKDLNLATRQTRHRSNFRHSFSWLWDKEKFDESADLEILT